MTTNNLNITQSSKDYINDTYNLTHQSDAGVKYTSTTVDVKITRSNNVSNFVGGSWRISNNKSPYTLYYANASNDANIPLSGWIDISSTEFDGVIEINNTPIISTPIASSTYTTSTPTITVTPTVTMTPTVTLNDSDTYILSATSVMPHNELTESVVIFARPTITHISHNTIKSQLPYNVLITGYSMQYTNSVFLSSSADLSGSRLYDDWVDYEPLYGFKINFEILSENEIIVSIPAVNEICELDIIISNTAGYGKLSPGYINKSTEWTEFNLQPTLIRSV
tara:strand:- start:70 stop:912 length:843 start_codon:yes stop_codon:yes gene_type:complete